MDTIKQHVAKVIASDGPDEEDAGLIEAMARAFWWTPREGKNDVIGSMLSHPDLIAGIRAALSAYRSHTREEVKP